MKTIILAGGSGTRLWPVSRGNYPKQFIKFQGQKESLFQKTFKRSLLISGIEGIYIVTNFHQKSLILNDIEELGYYFDKKQILVEPEAKNTLPAIYAGVNEILKTGNDSIVVYPSDHMIKNSDEIVRITKNSIELAKEYIITFGIIPEGPNTGYGYIAPGVKKRNGNVVEAFVEKPEYEQAVSYIQKGYLWNAGIFMFDAGVFSEEVKRLSPEIFNAFRTSDNIDEAFSKIETKVSIDYGVMEKSKKVAVVKADIGWSDIGSFDSLYKVSEKDEAGNVSSENNILFDSKNNMLQTYGEKIIAAVGVSDLILVDSSDALLVCKKDQTQSIKKVVEVLKNKGDKRTVNSRDCYYPWGQTTLIDESNISLIKRVQLKRDMNYLLPVDGSMVIIAESGNPIVVIGDKKIKVEEGCAQTISNSKGAYIENTSNEPLVFLQIQIVVPRNNLYV